MENNEIGDSGKNAAKTIGIINISAVALMVIGCFNENAAFLAFFLGLLAALINFVMMIVFISQRKTYAYIICIISMLLLPIIGFGCCAAGVKDMRF